jgi:hypothetical protein
MRLTNEVWAFHSGSAQGEYDGESAAGQPGTGDLGKTHEKWSQGTVTTHFIEFELSPAEE